MSDSPQDSNQDANQEEMPLVAHLIELRTRLMHIIGATLLVFFALVAFRNDLYTLLAAPLRSLLPVGSSMVATDITSSFLAPFKLTFLSPFLSPCRMCCIKFGHLLPLLYINTKSVWLFRY